MGREKKREWPAGPGLATSGDSSDRNIPIVSTLKDAFQYQLFLLTRTWAIAHNIDPLTDDSVNNLDFSSHEGAWLHVFAALWMASTLSTAFSGIDAPGHAAHGLDCCLAALMPALSTGLHAARAANNIFAIEIDNLCRHELCCDRLAHDQTCQT